VVPDGIIYLQAFQCGPDASVARDVAALATGHIPFLHLVLDHSTTANNFETRIEAFLDIVLENRRQINTHPTVEKGGL
jgi:predicted nucleotide-binding protein (sugar kinase/HSP70/actin superfamily)